MHQGYERNKWQGKGGIMDRPLTTRTPVMFGLTKSLGPPLFVATTGFEALHASRTTMPKGSFLEGTTTASQDLKSACKAPPPIFPTNRTERTHRRKGRQAVSRAGFISQAAQ